MNYQGYWFCPLEGLPLTLSLRVNTEWLWRDNCLFSSSHIILIQHTCESDTKISPLDYLEAAMRSCAWTEEEALVSLSGLALTSFLWTTFHYTMDCGSSLWFNDNDKVQPMVSNSTHNHLVSCGQVLSVCNDTVAFMELLFLWWVVFYYRRHDDVQNPMSLWGNSPSGTYQRLNSILSTMNTSSIIRSAGSFSTNFKTDFHATLTFCKVPSFCVLHSKLAVSKIQKGPTNLSLFLSSWGHEML